jgi:hypothetical protein
MEQMRELVDVAAFERLLVVVAVVAPLAGALVGLAVGMRRKTAKAGVAKGLVVGLLGPVLLGMWRLYDYLVRFDPATGYVGLHRVDVLLLNGLIFVAVGAVLGVAYGLLFRSHRGGDS